MELRYFYRDRVAQHIFERASADLSRLNARLEFHQASTIVVHLPDDAPAINVFLAGVIIGSYIDIDLNRTSETARIRPIRRF